MGMGMQRNLILRLGCLMLFLFAIESRADGKNPDSVHKHHLIATADLWCPYTCKPNTKKPGFLVEIVSEVFQKDGQTVEYQLRPWIRTLAETEVGKSDFALGIARGESERLIMNSVSLGKTELSLVRRAGETMKFGKLADLKDLRLGIIANYNYDGNGELNTYLRERSERGDNIEIIYHSKPTGSLLRLLTSGRIDAFFSNRYVVQYDARSLGFIKDIQIQATPYDDDVYVGFTPNDFGKQLAKQLDQGLLQLRESGRLTEIMNSYGLTTDEVTKELDSN